MIVMYCIVDPVDRNGDSKITLQLVKLCPKKTKCALSTKDEERHAVCSSVQLHTMWKITHWVYDYSLDVHTNCVH